MPDFSATIETSQTSLTLHNNVYWVQKLKSWHLHMRSFSRGDRSNMMLKLTVHPGKNIVYIPRSCPESHAGGEVSAQSSITQCGYVISRFGSVLSCSMCLWLWGGAPWTVNIGQAREGRRLPCVLHGLSVCQTHSSVATTSVCLPVFHFHCLTPNQPPRPPFSDLIQTLTSWSL